MPAKTKRALKVGLFLSTAEGSAGGHWSNLKAMARHAETAGFDPLWAADHLLFPLSNPDHVAPGRWECWSILAALAAATSRIELGTLVICTSFRNPALLAKMADTVEEISGGRVTLGLGAGWFEPEYHAFGNSVDHRLGRFEEALQIIHGLLRGRTIDFQGQYHQVRELELRPRGPRPGGPPILIGARADRPRSLRLTAQYADHWNTTQAHAAADIAPMREAVDNACVNVGRDPSTLLRTAHLLIDLPGSENSGVPAWVRAHRAARPVLRGTTEQLGESLRAFARSGISHVQVWLEPNTIAAIDAFQPALDGLDRGC
jgi:alkanesulfonate monooxygenase SsuD/methylene tetrahydromethanopterin reductase-like flavin-dependent oxidoreductase (luciferase family)